MPLGPYKTFQDCISAQVRKGKSKDSAGAICGQIEKNTKEGMKKASSNVKYEDGNDHLYIKAFLLDSTENINQWGVSPSSLENRINTFIGKPLVLTENFRHPMPPESHRAAANDYYDDDEDPYNTVNVNEIVEHWLQYQEIFRIGSIIDITEKNGIYYAIIEVTDPSAKTAFRNNDVPLFVSPAIAQLDPFEDASNITNWTGIHLAIVSNPAYTIKKAVISGQCRDDKDRCLLQLRQAAIEDKKIPRIGCGFCRTKVLARYAEVVKMWRTRHSVPVKSTVTYSNVDDFVNSSIHFSEPNSSLELTNDNHNQQQDVNNTHQQNNTQDNNTNQQEQDFEKKQRAQGGDLGDQAKKQEEGQGQPTKETVTKTETETETEKTEVEKQAEAVAVKVAGMNECITIFQQNGIQDPQQAAQICKLAAQAFAEQQQQNPNNPNNGAGGSTNGPPRNTGFTGSITEYEKELTKSQLKISELQEELKRYRKDDKTDAQRIAELEDTVTKLNRNLKEKEIESYLVTKIADEKFRNEKIKRFADLGLSLDDIKDIFETTVAPKGNTGNGSIKKVAEVQNQSILSAPSRVKLQVASTSNEGEGNSISGEGNNQQDTKANGSNEIRERNNRILSSLLSNKGFN